MLFIFALDVSIGSLHQIRQRESDVRLINCLACGKDIDLHEETQLVKCLRTLSKNSYRDMEADLP